MKNGPILQYFWPALSNNWSWKQILCLFESGCFTKVLLLFVWNQSEQSNYKKEEL